MLDFREFSFLGSTPYYICISSNISWPFKIRDEKSMIFTCMFSKKVLKTNREGKICDYIHAIFNIYIYI